MADSEWTPPVEGMLNLPDGRQVPCTVTFKGWRYDDETLERDDLTVTFDTTKWNRSN